MKKLNIFLFGLVLAVASGCTYSFPEPEQSTSGTADFTKVIAIGNSLSAGFMDGALYDAGQDASFVNIVGQQMVMANLTDAFNQPDIDSPVGNYATLAGPTYLGHLILVDPLNPAPAPMVPGDPFNDSYSGNKAELNNFAVPGMRLIDFDVAGYGNPVSGNKYFTRFAADPNTSSVQSDALAANGTFFIFWLGNNDVLGYATSGAVDPGSLVDATTFDTKYKSAVSTLITNNGNQGILINIPNVQDIPYFTTVAWNPVSFDDSDPVDAGTIAALNDGYQAYNAGLDAMVAGMAISQEEADARKISFGNGENAVVIIDNTLTDLTGINPAMLSMRQTTSSDLLTLTAGAVIPSGVGLESPLGEEYTLTSDDVLEISTRIAEFNASIKAVADGSGGNLALLDFNTIFADFAANGTSINGAGMDATLFPPFGAFSLDGVHPNRRGSAYVASLVIDKINETFGSNIQNVNPNEYPGNALPILP